METEQHNALKAYYQHLLETREFSHPPQPHGKWVVEMYEEGLSLSDALYLIAFLASKANLSQDSTPSAWHPERANHQQAETQPY
jgi:hypothetical protein